MKQYSKFLFIISLSLIFIACKKEEPAKDNENGLKLEGQWQLEKVNFLSENAHWNKNVDYEVNNYFGYAPSMFQLVLGFDFLSTKVPNNLGNKLIIYNEGGHVQDTSSDTWYWNYKDNKESFEMEQINPEMPPYNFSIMKIRNIETAEEGKRMTFTADLYSRIPGKTMTQTQILPASFTMKKGTGTYNAKIFILDEPFEY